MELRWRHELSKISEVEKAMSKKEGEVYIQNLRKLVNYPLRSLLHILFANDTRSRTVGVSGSGSGFKNRATSPPLTATPLPVTKYR